MLESVLTWFAMQTARSTGRRLARRTARHLENIFAIALAAIIVLVAVGLVVVAVFTALDRPMPEFLLLVNTFPIWRWLSL